MTTDIFWINAIDAAQVGLSNEAINLLSVIGEGNWRRPLIEISARTDLDRNGREARIYAAVHILTFYCIAVPKTIELYKSQGVEADHIYVDLAEYFLERIKFLDNPLYLLSFMSGFSRYQPLLTPAQRNNYHAAIE